MLPDNKSTYRDQNNLQSRVISYWESRANGFNLATNHILDEEFSSIKSMLESNVNINKKMKVLDVGTGAGLMATSFALMGHEVFAVDLSEAMLDYAESNAKNRNVEVILIKSDAQKLPFGNCEFDMVVSKDLLWSLNNPVIAYTELLRVLKPNGYLLIIDGNYYLDLYDSDYKQKKLYKDLKNGKNNSLHAKTNVDNVDFEIIRDIARDLPLSKMRRPSWDVSTLLSLGVKEINIGSLDDDDFTINAYDGPMKLISKFMILTKKTDISANRSLINIHKVKDADLAEISRKLSNDYECKDLCSILKSLSDKMRMDIVLALRSSDLNISQICFATGYPQSNVSHSLRILKDSNIVISEKIGKEVYYSLADPKSINRIINACEGMSKIH
ncbi:metalloregulator ArsR/SmtB family transcription factor [Candidatus Methanomassiliicoccus intestinalis]|uniref:metalloregulator ArsR/SmtB family transcription factor n=1 Tax=Candidatus Methanomassiliicoccus intestinalis TaxID=1406512 RepID=UPI0037DD0EA7